MDCVRLCDPESGSHTRTLRVYEHRGARLDRYNRTTMSSDITKYQRGIGVQRPELERCIKLFDEHKGSLGYADATMDPSERARQIASGEDDCDFERLH